jgi:Outer membrane protein beta-barrel domain
MRLRTTVSLVSSCLLLSAASARAEPYRSGFWFGLGAGYGSARVDCDGCGDTDREGSVSGYVRLGGTLNRHVLLGVRANGWTKEQSGTRVTLGNASGTLTLYPGAYSGFFLELGFGVAWVDTSVRQGAFDVSVSKAGFGVTSTLGWDLRIGRNVSLTPSLSYYYGRPGDISVDRVVVLPNLTQNVWEIALGITFH